MPRQLGPQSKYWCFTLNNPREEQCGTLFKYRTIKDLGKKVEYCIWQLERGGTGDTEHLQGYIILKHHQDLIWLKGLLSNRIHGEIAKGSTKDNIKYCTKKDSHIDGPWNYGNAPEKKEQGKRNDLLKIQHKLDIGIDMEQIAKDDFGTWCRYRSSFAAYLTLIDKPRNFKTQVIVLVGPPGCGKSWFAKKYTKNGHGGVQGYTCFDYKWYDGMKMGDDLIINDFVGTGMNYQKFLQLLDDGPWMLEGKGHVMNFRGRRIVITSNLPMDQWFNMNEVKGTYGALLRRVEYYFDEYGQAEENVPFFTDEWAAQQKFNDPYDMTDEEVDRLEEDLGWEMDGVTMHAPQDSPDWEEEEELNHKKRKRNDVIDLTTTEEEIDWEEEIDE